MHPLVNTYKNIHMHTNMYPLTQANTTLNTHIISLSLFCALLWYLNCSLALFSFTFCLHWTEYTRKLEKEKRRYENEACNQKLKLTLSDWAHYKPILVSSLFYPLHFVYLFSHSPYYFFPTTSLHKHEKGSCSAISAIQVSRDQGFNHKTISGLKKKKEEERIMKSWCKKTLTESHNNWHSEENWALQVKYHCQRLRHTQVLSL